MDSVTDQRVGQGTRDRIIEAARELFDAQGYEPTSLKHVAAAAGVHGGSVYHFFPTKERLVEAVLESYLGLLDPVLMAPARAASTDPVRQVMTLLGGYREYLLAMEYSRGCPIGSLALELAESHPAARDLVRQNLEAWVSAVASMVSAMALPAGIESRAVATLILTVMEGAVMQARSHRSIEPFDVSVGQLERYLQSLQVEGSSR